MSQQPATQSPQPATVPGWRFKPVREDNGDITCVGMATVFNDKRTRTGIPANRKGLIACSLPRGLCASTMGSGFEGVKDFTLVRIYCPATGRTIIAPVIDEGPSWHAEAGTGKPGSAMIDLTPPALEALGLKDNAWVHIRIIYGSHTILPAARKGLYR